MALELAARGERRHSYIFEASIPIPEVEIKGHQIVATRNEIRDPSTCRTQTDLTKSDFRPPIPKSPTELTCILPLWPSLPPNSHTFEIRKESILRNWVCHFSIFPSRIALVEILVVVTTCLVLRGPDVPTNRLGRHLQREVSHTVLFSHWSAGVQEWS